MRCLIAQFLLCILLTISNQVIAADRSAQNNYLLHCQGCHTPDGAGAAGKVPSIKNFMGNFLHVEGGREFLIQVPGASQSSLTDAQLAELTNWMLYRFSGDQIPSDFEPYTADEVGVLRQNTLIHVNDIRAQLLEKMTAVGIDVSPH